MVTNPAPQGDDCLPSRPTIHLPFKPVVLLILILMEYYPRVWSPGLPIPNVKFTSPVQISPNLGPAALPLHHSYGQGHVYQPQASGTLSSTNGMTYFLPPLPGYVPQSSPYHHYPHVTPSANGFSPPAPPTPNAPNTTLTRSPLGHSSAGGAIASGDLGVDVNLSRFTFAFQVWLPLDKQPKEKKAKWENMKGRNLTLPPGASLAHVSLREFKRMLAARCMHKGYPCGPRILQCDQAGQITWFLYVNGSAAFRRDANVQVKTDDEFAAWLQAAATAGTRTMGARLAMAHPDTVEQGRKISSKVRASLKRAQREYVASSEPPGDHEDSTDGEDTPSDETLDEDPHQALATRVSDIWAQLGAGHAKDGETPRWIDPRDPRHVITITPALFKVWAQDLLDKIPGVSISVPPLNRREFKSGKRTAPNFASVDEGTNENVPPVPQPTSQLTGRSAQEIEALALEIEVPLSEFLHFAQIREPHLVSTTSQQLTTLGMDAWFIFKSEDCCEELRALGMTFGTIKKLTIAVGAYETVLANRALNQVASGSGGQMAPPY